MMETQLPHRNAAIQAGRNDRDRAVGLALSLAAILACGLTCHLPAANAQGNTPAARKTLPAKSPASERAPWGEPAGGLRMRAIAVAPDTDEQKPDFQKSVLAAEYPAARDVTLLVEIQNVSDKPVSLQGTRYGDAVSPPWPGKSVSDSFAPYLFDCEVVDKSGKPVDHASREMLDGDAMISLSSGQAETIEPEKSLVVLIRPLGWDAALAQAVRSGEYSVRIRYRGPSAGVAKELQRVWPDKPLAKVWMGNVASAKVPVRIAESKQKPPALVWGDVVDGLQAALELRHPKRTPQAARDTATATFAHGTQLDVRVHIKNAGEKERSFWSETWRQDDKVVVIGWLMIALMLAALVGDVVMLPALVRVVCGASRPRNVVAPPDSVANPPLERAA